MRKNVKVKPGWWPLPFARVLSHHVITRISYMCTPYASNVGDVPEYLYPVHICDIILSYAFKMRQDYLSTSYLLSPGEKRGRYELIQVTCAVILSHFESI